MTDCRSAALRKVSEVLPERSWVSMHALDQRVDEQALCEFTLLESDRLRVARSLSCLSRRRSQTATLGEPWSPSAHPTQRLPAGQEALAAGNLPGIRVNFGFASSIGFAFPNGWKKGSIARHRSLVETRFTRARRRLAGDRRSARPHRTRCCAPPSG